MLVTRTSIQTKQTYTLEIPITQADLDHFELSGYPPKGLPSNHVRFLTNGTTDEEWQNMLDELDKEDDTDANKRYHK